MIHDALGGSIDLILTKSVSRFARNTVDSLTTVRMLKEKGVEVYFEKENIYTFDSKGELLITIMSSLAQEESRSISENVTWGVHKRFADGKVSMPYRRFLGYAKGEDGTPVVVESEAKTVRLIYKLFLDGKTPSAIAKHLTEQGIPTPGNKEIWTPSTVKSILTNEKYKGDALLQKSYTVDFLSKKKKKNNGEMTSYYVGNSHPAIVSAEIFDTVQLEMKRRSELGLHKNSADCFSGRVICGDCGGQYGSKIWHSTDKYRRVIWQCNRKFKNAEKCTTPHLDEHVLRQAFIEVFNGMLKSKDEIISAYEEIAEMLTDTSKLENKRSALIKESKSASEQLMSLISKNAHTAMSREEYNAEETKYFKEYDSIKSKLEKAEAAIAAQQSKRRQILTFISHLKGQNAILTGFDEALFASTVDTVTVFTDRRLLFRFKDGTEIQYTIS